MKSVIPIVKPINTHVGLYLPGSNRGSFVNDEHQLSHRAFIRPGSRRVLGDVLPRPVVVGASPGSGYTCLCVLCACGGDGLPSSAVSKDPFPYSDPRR